MLQYLSKEHWQKGIFPCIGIEIIFIYLLYSDKETVGSSIIVFCKMYVILELKVGVECFDEYAKIIKETKLLLQHEKFNYG